MEKQEWEKELEASDLMRRIEAVETMAQIHGTPPYHGQTIQEFIKFLLSRELEAQQIEDVQFFLNILKGIDLAHEEMGNNHGDTKAIRAALAARYSHLAPSLKD
jgi:hypothetical protein